MFPTGGGARRPAAIHLSVRSRSAVPAIRRRSSPHPIGRATLGWQPKFDDLGTIVGHALGWERKLSMRNS
jgi:hypothetical protein